MSRCFFRTTICPRSWRAAFSKASAWRKLFSWDRRRKRSQLRGWLRRKADIGLRTIGLLSDEPIEQTRRTASRFWATPTTSNSVIRERGITQVIMLEFPLFTDINRNIISVCDQLGVRLLIVSDLEEKLRHPVTHFEDDGFRFIGLREEPLENPLNRFFKRAIDIAIALPGHALRLSRS